MPSVLPYVREVGSGPEVVCIHCNASSSAQWRALADLISARHRVLTPDSYGSGKSADWHSDREITLLDEVRFLEPVLRSSRAPLVLVGHSYGAAVALLAALQEPDRIRALVLYEPTLFALVDAQEPPPNSVDGIRLTVAAAATALDLGDTMAAAKHFVDFWSGDGTWDATPADRKQAIARSSVNVRRWGHALFTEPTPLEAFAELRMPVLYMLGGRSPASAYAVANVLLPVLPNARVLHFTTLGHMGPVTHPEVVNAAVARFLGELSNGANDVRLPFTEIAV
jgi:pimeloyl-ACP methyl ester carboxylesterase